MTAQLTLQGTSCLSCYIDGMEIMVNVADEIADQARPGACRWKHYVEDILAQRAAAQPSAEHPRTPAQIRAWLDSLAQFSDKIPPLPETISREWIYQDHDYMAIARCLVDPIFSFA